MTYPIIGTVHTPAGTFDIVRTPAHHPAAKLGRRHCLGCGMQIVTDDDGLLGLAWTKVFVRECYEYCCSCCPHSYVNPCPKEVNEHLLDQERNPPR